jgi:hypothetical protein
MAKVAGKLILLVMLSCAFFVAYSLSTPLTRWVFGSTFKIPLEFTVGTLQVQGLFFALVWGIVFALPLAWLWGRFAFLAALACVAPVILITLVAYSERPRQASTFLATILFIISLATIVSVAAQAAHWLLRRRATLTSHGQ